MRIPLVVLIVSLLLFVVFLWKHHKKLVQHSGVSRDEFISHFRNIGVVDIVSGTVYDHFRQMVAVRGYEPDPTDSIEETFSMTGEDLDDELGDLLPKLGLEMPHSGILQEWDRPIQTLSDVVRWVDWVRAKQNSEGSSGARNRINSRARK